MDVQVHTYNRTYLSWPNLINDTARHIELWKTDQDFVRIYMIL